jgi:hypothetical protein
MVKNVATSNLPSQAFKGFIRSQNKNQFLDSVTAFFRKSCFYTLADLYHEFGNTWDIFWNFLINDPLIMLQTNAFGPFSF